MSDFATGGVIPAPELADGRIPPWIGAGCSYVIPDSRGERRRDLLRHINEQREDTER